MSAACPVGARCECCGSDADGLAVVERATPLGEVCLTACRRCAASTAAPPVSVSTAARFVEQHARHLAAARVARESARTGATR